VKVWPVDSKKTMLKPQDIFAVAAHEYKQGLDLAKEPAKKAGVSPERMSYTIMVTEYSDPRLIRVRCGNTLFTIAALPERTGFVRGYNADIAPNYINNMIELAQAARKMGFDTLLAYTTEPVVRALKIALRRTSEVKVQFDSANQAMVVTTGPARD
jgi:hypothetical protein